MDTTSSIKPKTMAELLPGLSSILTKDSIQTLTAKKQPRETIAGTRTAEKVAKPLTLAEMRDDLLPLKVQSPRMQAQGAPSTKKKIWNSSVKVDGKIVSLTANGQMKNNPVRKVLNFQPKSKTLSKASTVEAPKFNKPEMRAKRSLHQFHARNNVRISGVSSITDTPVVKEPSGNQFNRLKQNKFQYTGKENTPLKDKKPPYVPDSPLSNFSWKSSGDTSFLLNEKEIHEQEKKREYMMTQIGNKSNHEASPSEGLFYPLQDSNFNSEDPAMNGGAPKFGEEDTATIFLADLLGNYALKGLVNKQPPKPEDILHFLEQATIKQINIIDNTRASLTKLKNSQTCILTYLKRLEQQIKNEKPKEELHVKPVASHKSPMTSSTAHPTTTVTIHPTSTTLSITTTDSNIKSSPNLQGIAIETKESDNTVNSLGTEQNSTIETKAKEKINKLPEEALDVHKPQSVSAPKYSPIKYMTLNNETLHNIATSSPRIDPIHQGNTEHDKLKQFNKTESHTAVNASDAGNEIWLDGDQLLKSSSVIQEDKKKNDSLKFEYTATKSTSKLPSYKIPSRKGICLRKKLLRNCMSNVSVNYETPTKSTMSDQALDIYMKLKKQMNFLNTPNVKQRRDMLDSPSITSFNLQNQLDDLYGDS